MRRSWQAYHFTRSFNQLWVILPALTCCAAGEGRLSGSEIPIATQIPNGAFGPDSADRPMSTSSAERAAALDPENGRFPRSGHHSSLRGISVASTYESDGGNLGPEGTGGKERAAFQADVRAGVLDVCIAKGHQDASISDTLAILVSSWTGATQARQKATWSLALMNRWQRISVPPAAAGAPSVAVRSRETRSLSRPR